MNNISKSPNRLTFQKERYLQRCIEKGEEINPDYLEMFLDNIKSHDSRFDDPKSRIDNLEYDLLTTDWILEKAKNNVYAQNLYAALCNNEFTKNDVWPRLQDKRWGCSWRRAGGIVADMQQKGDYIDWYCTGIRDARNLDDEEFNELTKEQQEYYIEAKSYVSESHVTEEIRIDLLKLGWIVLEDT